MTHELFFRAAFVYLLSVVIGVWTFKKLGLSSVLGYLVTGVLIGPFGLSLVGSEGADVMHFAEFGVVMMLFLVGLEMKPSLLWRLRGPIFGLGGGQVVLTTAAVAAIGIAIGLKWQVALATGMCLALSSTAIVLQTLKEKGQSSTSGGRSAFAVLLFQDIAVIPILALLPLLATLTSDHRGAHPSHGSELNDASSIELWLNTQPGWMNTLLVLVAVAVIILAGKYVMRPVLRSVATTGVREAFIALALILVIGISLVMTWLGVSAALGTFLAGVVLADSEYRHELEADIEPFKGLLLGVFFISVGVSIDFSLILQNPLRVIGIVIGLMAVKTAVLFGLGSAAKLVLDQRFMFSLSLSQGSEFAFVLLGFCLASGVMDADLVQLLVASVALTMALTPLIMIIEERFLRVRFGTQTTMDRPPDAIPEHAPVILAGVGRFGNFVARMLIAQKIPITVIDSDPDHVEFLRNIGISTYYGDVVRHDLLEAAGASQAKLLIVAIDDESQIDELIQTVRRSFPHLEIVVRAQSRNHQYELLNLGINGTVHQHAGSAVRLGELALRKLGYRAYQAANVAKMFLKQDEKMAREIAPTELETPRFFQQVRERIRELESSFEMARHQPEEIDQYWDLPKRGKDNSEEA